VASSSTDRASQVLPIPALPEITMFQPPWVQVPSAAESTPGTTVADARVCLWQVACVSDAVGCSSLTRCGRSPCRRCRERVVAGVELFTQLCPPCSMSFRVAATITMPRAGDLQQARARLKAAERIAGMWQGGPWLAAIWEARGVLRRSEGDHPQAAALFKEAANQFAQANRPVDEARCRAAAAAPPDLDGHLDRPIGQVRVRDPTGVGPLGFTAEENTFS
jgi:hypothetical protein